MAATFPRSIPHVSPGASRRAGIAIQYFSSYLGCDSGACASWTLESFTAWNSDETKPTTESQRQGGKSANKELRSLCLSVSVVNGLPRANSAFSAVNCFWHQFRETDSNTASISAEEISSSTPVDSSSLSGKGKT